MTWTSVHACSCIGKETVEKARKNSDLVVVGTVVMYAKVKIWTDTSYARSQFARTNHETSYEEFKWQSSEFGHFMMEFTVVVKEKFKGAVKNDTVKVWTGFGGGDCGFQFQIGSDYVIYARSESSIKYSQPKLGRSKRDLKGIYRTTICDRTRSVEFAEEDLQKLKKN